MLRQERYRQRHRIDTERTTTHFDLRQGGWGKAALERRKHLRLATPERHVRDEHRRHRDSSNSLLLGAFLTSADPHRRRLGLVAEPRLGLVGISREHGDRRGRCHGDRSIAAAKDGGSKRHSHRNVASMAADRRQSREPLGVGPALRAQRGRPHLQTKACTSTRARTRCSTCDVSHAGSRLDAHDRGVRPLLGAQSLVSESHISHQLSEMLRPLRPNACALIAQPLHEPTTPRTGPTDRRSSRHQNSRHGRRRSRSSSSQNYLPPSSSSNSVP